MAPEHEPEPVARFRRMFEEAEEKPRDPQRDEESRRRDVVELVAQQSPEWKPTRKFPDVRRPLEHFADTKEKPDA